MHELSIATSLVELASDALERAGETRRVEAVQVRIGALSGVVVEALEFSWDVAIEGTVCSSARLDIERVPARISCDSCGAETELSDPPRFRCGVCDEPSANIVSGQELDLVSLELFNDPDTPAPEATPEAAHS